MDTKESRIPKILELISEIWQYNTNLRLGQMLCNASSDFEDNTYSIRDEDVLAALKRQLRWYRTAERLQKLP